MPAGPVQETSRFLPSCRTFSRYNRDRYDSVVPPSNGNRASSTVDESTKRAMELFVVPKSIPTAPLVTITHSGTPSSQIQTTAGGTTRHFFGNPALALISRI